MRAKTERHVVHRAHRAERMGVGDSQSLHAKDRRAHTDCRSRGLAISSRPTVRKNSPRNTIRMMTIGATHHHHQPFRIAALKLTQYSVMPKVGDSSGPSPSTSSPTDARIAAETAFTK